MDVQKIIVAIASVMKFNSKKKGTCLVVNTGAVGDFIHSLNAITYVTQQFHTSVLAKEAYASIAPTLKFINENTAVTQKFDVILNFNAPQSLNAFLLANNTFDFLGDKILKKYISHTWKEVHWSEYYLTTVQKLFPTTTNVLQKKLHSKPTLIVIHPGSSMAEKNWPLENFITVGKVLSKKSDVRFLIGPQDTALKETITARGFKIYNSTSFADLHKLAKKTKLYIGNDSGPMHFFSLYDCKILGIYTIGCAYTHYPYSNNAWYYFEEEVFQEYYKKGKITHINLQTTDCLKQINHILAATNKLEKRFGKVKINEGLIL